MNEGHGRERDQLKHIATRLVPLWIFVFFAALYMLVSPGVLNNPDAATRLLTAVSLVRNHTIELDLDDTRAQRFEVVSDIRGRYVELFTEGQSLMLATILWPLLDSGYTKANDPKVIEFCTAAIILPLISALTLPCFWLFLRLFCQNDRVNLAACFLFGVSTSYLIYAYNGHHESQLALFLILHSYGMIRYLRGDGHSFLLLSAITLGAMVLWRPNLVYYGPIAAAWILWEGRRLSWRSSRIVGALAILTSVSILVFSPQFFFNYFKTGHPLSFGNDRAYIGLAYHMSGSWLQGLRVCLLSSGKSVFLFNPVALLSAILFVRYFSILKNQPYFPVFAYGAANALFVLHLVFWRDHGEISWGVRFFVHTAFMFVLPVWYALQVDRGRPLRAAVWIVALLGVYVQLLGTLYGSELDYGAVRDSAQVYGENPNMSDVPILWWRTRDFAELLSKRAVFVPARFQCLAIAPKYFVPQWWWVRLLHDPKYGVPPAAVLAALAGLVVLLLLSGSLLIRYSRS